MFRDFKFLRRDPGKNSNTEEVENVPVNSQDLMVTQTNTDSSRAPLNTIQEPIPNSKSVAEQEVGVKITKIDRTPTKAKTKVSNNAIPLRTPEKPGISAKNRFGWVPKNESSSFVNESRDEGRGGGDMTNYTSQSSRGIGVGNGSFANLATPRPNRAVGRANSSYSDCNSTQSTPTKSVTKPPNPGLFQVSGSRPHVNAGGPRVGNYAALSKGLPISCSSSSFVNTVEVPHFVLKEDPSFWMEHSVQVLIRIRPLNSTERNLHGYNRCLKQESAQCITWIGQPETRFTFDHVACETVDQETLFRMVGLPMVENCLSGYNSCMFAYGQTGSGKTYTMLGEMEELEGGKPSQNRGMTPRIFEFLFARIRDEEESRRDERLTYNCKCSFLEIYNEQVSDLLDPSSTNLLLREDTKKGVYVENLSEFEVQTVGDILKLLIQGSSNRKVAATNMNRESSRSHSVFTCVIESRWEKDATSNLRFARLNLVDLAGSERQKSSGAEGERLKEAANINKSLSTLGHVIMVLVDVANGKPRHVPYRDSRLTFLLQDSLGGNSKTMIIANVSPSICCATETLNTLKFAQRAKLIKNNAVVNEDSSGDVIALQHQIRVLKEELSAFKRQNVSRSLSFGPKTMVDVTQEYENAVELHNFIGSESKGVVTLSGKQLKSLESTLTGALRREQMAETSLKQLEAEIEQLNRLVCQREEDTRCTKMMLKFREDKIQRMESLVGGLLGADAYLLEENSALSEEIQLLQAKVDRNPEVTRFALENIRLLEQIRRFQDFYEEGEREMLLAELSELRDQLVYFLDGNSKQHEHPKVDVPRQEALCISKENDSLHLELNKTLNELEECRNNLSSCLEKNTRLRREIDDLHASLNNHKFATQDHGSSVEVIKEPILEAPSMDDQLANGVQEENGQAKREIPMKHTEEVMNLQLEVDILKIILKEERSSRAETQVRELCLSRDLELTKEKILSITRQCEDVKEELKEAKSVIEALESQQILSINEMEDLRNSNRHYAELLSKQELEISTLKEQMCFQVLRDPQPFKYLDSEDSSLQGKFKKMHDSLEKAKRLNTWYQSDRSFQASNEEEMDEVRRQVEAETAEAIVCMQDELAVLHQQVQDSNKNEREINERFLLLQTESKEFEAKLHLMAQDNKMLGEKLEEKDKELRTISSEWELLTREIELLLADGNEALKDASDQLDFVSSLFPCKRNQITEQVGKIKKVISEKELLIKDLNQCLEDANSSRCEMECMLQTLRGAALVFTEAHEQECREKEKEIFLLTSQLSSITSTIRELENKIKQREEQIQKATNCATVAFVIVNRFSEIKSTHIDALEHKDACLHNQTAEINEANKQIQSLGRELHTLEECCSELRMQLSVEQKRACAMNRKLEEIQESDILKTSEKLTELKIGVSTLVSFMNEYAEQDVNPDKNNAMVSRTCKSNDGQHELETGKETKQDRDNVDSYAVEELKTEISDCSFKVGRNPPECLSDHRNLQSGRIWKDEIGRDATIVLVKNEIESALDSLKGVQAEMAKLRVEKEQVWLSEKQSQNTIKNLGTQVLSLQAAMNNFEKQFIFKMEFLDCKLRTIDETVKDADSCWLKEKELVERELGDAKVVAVQKTAEASCVLAKFEEVQGTMKDADILMNELMIANETVKVEIEELKQIKVALINEKDILIKEVQSLQSANDLKDCHYEKLEKQFDSDLLGMKRLVLELEDINAQVQITLKETFMSIAGELLGLKSELHDSTKLMRSWIEEIWSEIFVKDCAVSVLHLCHMGILLEAVGGLNAENSLLHHGLSESNSVISELREHNFKSRRELEMCRILKGKLLADIKNGFDRIARKEDETSELAFKLKNFEKKITDLQLQEELMLLRSNHLGSELALLMEELDLSNRNMLVSLLDQEKSLKDREDDLKSQEESFMIDLSAKDFEFHILASELEQMAFQKSNVEKERQSGVTNLENFKRELIFVSLDAELKESISLDNISMLETSSLKLQNELKMKDVQLSKISFLEEENESLENEVRKLKAEHCSVLTDLDIARAELNELRLSHSVCRDELCSKGQDLQIHADKINSLKEENVSLKNELQSQLKNNAAFLSAFNPVIMHCVDSIENLDMVSGRIVDALNDENATSEKMFQEMREKLETTSKFMEELECLEILAKELMSENVSLQTELSRKDDVLKGLLFDLSLLQESASNTKDRKDEIEELVASFEALENELAVRLSELDEAVANGQELESQLQEKKSIICILQQDISKMHETVKSLSSKNLELTVDIEDALKAKKAIEEELAENRKVNETLETELIEMGISLNKMNDSTESLKGNLDVVTRERDDLHTEVLVLKEKLEMAQALAEENNAVAIEARQIAESRKLYADEKEEEVKLLERSVEELESTVDVLENKVDIVKGEAERQRLEREELEMEFHAVQRKMHNLKTSHTDMQRHLDEGEKNLQEALRRMQLLEKEIAAKDAEIAQCKLHITELNLCAEVQACEYKQKFKELEAMIEQVKTEGPPAHVTNASSSKLEKNGSKSKGSGSPFKCIGLGLVQQIKSERDEELTAGRLRIEELEALAASRQKEIFVLNAKLAATESMTHDVNRDLLGLRLDMTNFAALLDMQQAQKITEKAQDDNVEAPGKEQEAIKLKQLLNEFIEERRAWLEEIDRKQAEIVAAQVALEKLRQQVQLITAENEMFKMENANHKKKVTELEAEVKKLSGQQNIQQRIHHHAKIKEENNFLKSKNEDLSIKLQRTDAILARVKEELARFRASNGRSPFINFDEEQRLNEILKETEEERLQLAKKLVGLCTGILKAAGITTPVSNVSVSMAEEALEQLKDRVASLERELQDVKFKNRITNERFRLSELVLQPSPFSSRTDENRRTPNRASQTPFLSVFR